jgi:hypothetical protein
MSRKSKKGGAEGGKNNERRRGTGRKMRGRRQTD